MIDDLTSYPQYKESGLPWLGLAPTHWATRRMKVLFGERIEKGYPNEPLLAATQTKGVVRKEDYGERTVTAQKDLHLLKLVEPDDFVVSLRSFQGGIEYARCRGIISPAYTILTPKEGTGRGYYSYFLKARPFVDSLTLFVTGIREGQNIDYPRLSRAYMPYPPPAEQVAIVRFLDHANAKIEGAIRVKRKLIALLNEQNQAIINRAVTRGLDTNVTLKPAGIPWLGEVPEHWDVLRAKYIFSEVDERSNTGEEELLSVSHITGVTPRSEKNITMFKAASYVGHKLCRPGDLVINTMWAWMAALGSSTRLGIVSSSYGVYRPKKQRVVFGKYVDSLLHTPHYMAEILCRSTGIRGSRLRLYPEQFLNMPLLLPPFNEQESMFEWADSETKELNAAIARTEREIALLREYRTTLTADVVTGKLDVRGAAAALPDEAEELPPSEVEEIDDSEAEELEDGA